MTSITKIDGKAHRKKENVVRGIWNFVILACSLLLLFGCSAGTDGKDDDPGGGRIHADLVQGVTLQEVSDVLAGENVTVFTARVVYTEHEAYVQVDESQGGVEKVLVDERARLAFLRDQFSENDMFEAPIKERFTSDIDALDASSDLLVRWVEYDGVQVDLEGLADQQSLIEEPEDPSPPNSSGVGKAQQAIVTDYTGDAWWVPAGGTSTIYTTGTLQKFWLDSSALSLVDDPDSGLEIDTVIWGESNATCSTSGVSSNMPGYYADTEALDEGNRNCSVGTVSASQLQTWTLYWTWHPFGSFNAGANPFIAVMYQAKDWCPWVSTTVACYANKPWCMCSIGFPYQNPYPTEWLISYNYNDRPGQETSWTKN